MCIMNMYSLYHNSVLHETYLCTNCKTCDTIFGDLQNPKFGFKLNFNIKNENTANNSYNLHKCST